MKRSLMFIICLGLFLFGPYWFLDALEVEFIGGVNNMAFDPYEREQIEEFNGFPYDFVDFSIKSDISSSLGLNVHFKRDNILQNNLSGKIITYTNYINLDFGAFFSMEENAENPNFGIIGGIEFIFPHIIFLALNGSSSIGFNNELNNSQETAEAKLGFWLPYMFPVFSVGMKSFTREYEDSMVVQDKLLRFQFSIDIFNKNFPVILRIDTGYQAITRSYSDESFENIDLGVVFTGFEVKWQITKPLRLIAGFEAPVHIKESEKEAPSLISLYKAYGGVTWTFF